MKTPNKERIRLWVDALESDEFEQGTEFLVSTVDGIQRHCCLGVAARVPFRNDVAEPPRDRVFGTTWHNEAYLPLEVARWFGLDRNPDLDLREQNGVLVRESATSCNDQLGLNFTGIAAAIRRTYLDEEEAIQ